MQEPNQDAGSLAALYAALAKAQAGFTAIHKDRDGQSGNQKFKYANLAQLIEATRPALTSNGLALFQLISTNDDGRHVISTTLAHDSGAAVVTSVVVANANFDRIQDYGKVVTYMRRYAYSAILCLAADDEEDADSMPLEGAEPNRPAAKEPPQPAGKPDYPQAKFDQLLPARAEGVASGATTVENIIAMIETRANLTDSQRKTLEALEGPSQ